MRGGGDLRQRAGLLFTFFTTYQIINLPELFNNPVLYFKGVVKSLSGNPAPSQRPRTARAPNHPSAR